MMTSAPLNRRMQIQGAAEVLAVRASGIDDFIVVCCNRPATHQRDLVTVGGQAGEHTIYDDLGASSKGVCEIAPICSVQPSHVERTFGSSVRSTMLAIAIGSPVHW